jgi:hypothetical protein
MWPNILVNFLQIIQCQISQLLLSKERFNPLSIINVLNCNKKNIGSTILSVCICVCSKVIPVHVIKTYLECRYHSKHSELGTRRRCILNFMPLSHYGRKEPHKPISPGPRLYVWTQEKSLNPPTNHRSTIPQSSSQQGNPYTN